MIIKKQTIKNVKWRKLIIFNVVLLLVADMKKKWNAYSRTMFFDEIILENGSCYNSPWLCNTIETHN